jgi:hypothetical protein
MDLARPLDPPAPSGLVGSGSPGGAAPCGCGGPDARALAPTAPSPRDAPSGRREENQRSQKRRLRLRRLVAFCLPRRAAAGELARSDGGTPTPSKTSCNPVFDDSCDTGKPGRADALGTSVATSSAESLLLEDEVRLPRPDDTLLVTASLLGMRLGPDAMHPALTATKVPA